MYTQLKPIWFIFFLAAFTACKSARETKTSTLKDVTAGTLLDHMVQNQIKADWLEAKARISYDGEDQSVSASATMVIRKDSLVWMSVRKLGFEVARVQIDRDSVYMINRLSNEYTIQGLDYLAHAYNLPADLKTIQAILLGNPVFLNARELKLDGGEENSYHLVSASGQTENHFWLDAVAYLLIRARYADLRSRRQVDLFLRDYQPLDTEQKFSYLREIKVDSSELGAAAIEIDFSDVKINIPQEIRFSIPSRYTRID